jgi:hypothetical protein
VDLLAILLSYWAHRLARRLGAPRWLRWVLPVLVASYVLSTIGTIWGLYHAFASVSGGGANASMKQQLLAEGIRRAMVFEAVGIAVDVGAFVLLLVQSWRAHTTTVPP